MVAVLRTTGFEVQVSLRGLGVPRQDNEGCVYAMDGGGEVVTRPVSEVVGNAVESYEREVRQTKGVFARWRSRDKTLIQSICALETDDGDTESRTDYTFCLHKGMALSTELHRFAHDSYNTSLLLSRVKLFLYLTSDTSEGPLKDTSGSYGSTTQASILWVNIQDGEVKDYMELGQVTGVSHRRVMRHLAFLSLCQRRKVLKVGQSFQYLYRLSDDCGEDPERLRKATEKVRGKEVPDVFQHLPLFAGVGNSKRCPHHLVFPSDDLQTETEVVNEKNGKKPHDSYIFTTEHIGRTALHAMLGAYLGYDVDPKALRFNVGCENFNAEHCRALVKSLQGKELERYAVRDFREHSVFRVEAPDFRTKRSPFLCANICSSGAVGQKRALFEDARFAHRAPGAHSVDMSLPHMLATAEGPLLRTLSSWRSWYTDDFIANVHYLEVPEATVGSVNTLMVNLNASMEWVVLAHEMAERIAERGRRLAARHVNVRSRLRQAELFFALWASRWEETVESVGASVPTDGVANRVDADGTAQRVASVVASVNLAAPDTTLRAPPAGRRSHLGGAVGCSNLHRHYETLGYAGQQPFVEGVRLEGCACGGCGEGFVAVEAERVGVVGVEVVPADGPVARVSWQYCGSSGRTALLVAVFPLAGLAVVLVAGRELVAVLLAVGVVVLYPC